jgi:hypothetical protein
VDFWSSLGVEIIGGIVTALALGAGAACFAASQQIRVHDDRIADLDEDNRRWFRDRNARLSVALERLAWDHAARGVSDSSIAEGDKLAAKQAAMHEYRDEITAKRRRYRDIRHAEGWIHGVIRRRLSRPLKRFALSEDQRTTLATWRERLPHEGPLRDPTDSTDSDLRRFEADGGGIAFPRRAGLDPAGSGDVPPAGGPEVLHDRTADCTDAEQSGVDPHLTFREIGARLYLSPHTVKSHAMSIYRKLDVTSRGAAVDQARHVGLL